MSAQTRSAERSVLQRAPMLIVAAVVIVGLAIGGYFLFRRTLIADFREQSSGVNLDDQIAYGQLMFDTRGCIGCHTLDSSGATGTEGPILNGIASRHDADYIRESIQYPAAVTAANCPEGPCEAGGMPDYGAILTEDQIDALVAYLLTQR